jgi:hypothetical protein
LTTFNWSDLQQAAADAGFSLVPDGSYHVEIVKATAGETSTKKDKIACQFKILAGPQTGGTFFEDFIISPESAVALGFFFRHMAVFGLGKEYFAQNPPMEQVAAALVGRQAQADVIVDYSYFEDGKNKIKKLTKVGAGTAPGVVRFMAATPLPGNDIFAAPPPPPAATQAPADAVPPPPPLPTQQAAF